MIISGVTQKELKMALNYANTHFAGNLGFRELKPLNKEKTKWRITLRVRSSQGPGHSRGSSRYNFRTGELIRKGKRLPYACWHAHGVFFDSLPRHAHIFTRGAPYFHPGTPWADWNAGSKMFPEYMSSRCDCER